MEETGIYAASENAATPDSNAVATVTPPRTTRRDLMTAFAGAAFAAGAGALLAGCGSGSGTSPTSGTPIGVINPGATPTPTPSPNPTPLDPTRLTDPDILNFALNLEYLEAEFYLRAIGQTLTASEAGGSSAGSVTGGRTVNFTSPAVQQYAQEIANDERNHVNFLRNALQGAAVVRPQIDFTTAFNAAAQAAGIGSSFDPFADQTSFLLGAFIFEDVGVTAYRGGSRFLRTPGNIGAAAGILAVEAIHAGVIRHLINDLGGSAVTIANQISALRAAAGGGKDEGVVVGGVPNFVPAQNNTLVYSRTTAEVLRIVYLTPTGFPSSGGFFPQGVNGTIRQAV